MDVPEEFEGTVSIVWPPPRPGRDKLSGALIRILRDGQPVHTVTSLAVIQADAAGLIWAELTMFADKDGHPIYTGAACYDDHGELITGTYPFLVAEMLVDPTPR